MIDLASFNVIEKIGSGSYSTVYKAQPKTGVKEYVAVKVVEQARLSARGKDDIVTEIKVMRMLKHKHIVEMKDFKWDANNIYIIMEYCNGGDLSTFIKRRCKLTEKTCQKFLQQLAIGLQFLRSHGLSHLDLKPQNLLLVTKPKLCLKIGDFGFAQFLNDSTQKNSIRGSPLYMAPEMLLNKTYDVKADLWSVGVITYECLFGKAPYSSGSYDELCTRIRAKAPIVIPDHCCLSKECKDFLHRLLQHDPKSRMNYDEFFKHSFLDLEHVPSETNYKKSLKILSEAEHLERLGRNVEAFNKYSEGLRYLFPIYDDEIVGDKKSELRAKVYRYTKRAEELKCTLSFKSDMQTDSSSSSSSTPSMRGERSKLSATSNCSSAACVDEVDEVDGGPSTNNARNSSLKSLLSMCSRAPNLSTALEIGMNAQMYLAEGKYELALEKFQSSLGILIHALPDEPNGKRKELLYLQVEEWMKQAESTKSLISVQQTNDNLHASDDYKGKKKKVPQFRASKVPQ